MADQFPLAQNQSILNPAQQGGLLTIPTTGMTPELVAQAGGGQVVPPQPLITGGQATAAGLGGVTAGTQVAPPTLGEAAFDVLGATAGGAAAGAVVGGPVGALIGGGLGLVVSLGKSFFSVSQSRKKARELRKMARRAEEAQRRAEEKAEKWRKINRIDNLRVAEQNRNQNILQAGWSQYVNKLNLMTNFVNQNAQLRNTMLAQLRT